MIELICKIKMKKKFILLLLFIVCSNINLYSQKDTSKSILSDIDIQIESTDAINKMYNFNFDEAFLGMLLSMFICILYLPLL